MNNRRKLLISFGSVAVALIVVGTTLLSYSFEPAVIHPFNPTGYGVATKGISYSEPVYNNSFNIVAGNDHGLVHITYGSTLVQQAGNISANLSKDYIYGALSWVFSCFFTITNESVGTSGTTLSFYVENFSLNSNNTTLLFPMSAFDNYLSPANATPGRQITFSNQIHIISSTVLINLVHLRGPTDFWFNFTVVPVMELGPYYVSGTPVALSVSWTDYF